MTKRVKLVNWQDGMKMSSANFRQTENFFIQSISDTSAMFLTNYNYGLLPLKQSNSDSGIVIREHVTDHIEIQLHHCHAITSAGTAITFNLDGDSEPLVKNYSPQADQNSKGKQHTHWDVILSVNPQERVATGELDVAELPPRHPDVESKYSLSIMPTGETNLEELGSNFIIIGRIRKDGTRYMADGNYIPPATSMLSYPDLLEYYERFATSFQSLEKSSRNIIEKINRRPDSSQIALNIKELCEDILYYIASVYFTYKNKGRFTPPIQTTEYISTLAHTCYINLISMNGKQKDELLQYFYEWSDVTPGSFEEILSETLEIVYDHNNIRAMMIKCDQFLTTMKELWERLSHLEYIGQHKESIIISVSGGDSRVDPKRSWSTQD